jgi:glycosyltransferase involved in cell wall biosynthesis
MTSRPNDLVQASLTPANAGMPLISAVVCTRNRGDSIVCTLRSILANTHPHFELIVIDQSSNRETAKAVAPFLEDARLRFLPSETVGKGVALNLALEEARGEVIALTDDDCEAPPDWLEKIAGVFVENPRTAVAFFNVEAASHDANAGFVPAYRREGSKRMTRIRDWCATHGIGAGMAVRREAIRNIGGFDARMGPGCLFPAYEDGDLALRALLNGYEVYETDATCVLHYGFRTWAEGRDLARRDWYSIGAGHAKLVKCGRWRVLAVSAHELWKFVFRPLILDTLRLRKPPVMVRGLSFARGFIAGWRSPVDRQRMVFRERDHVQ